VKKKIVLVLGIRPDVIRAAKVINLLREVEKIVQVTQEIEKIIQVRLE
jgi:UDP-N-acetylglucosamine 2-epimerase